MKNLLFLPVLFILSTVQAQVSYDFSEALPPEGKSVISVSKPYYGSYNSKQVDVDYEIKKDGIWAVATIYSSISRETIRESSKYKVKNDFLFGITEEDSIPCVLQGEFYHFALKYKEQIAGGDSKNVLVKLSETSYILNFETDGHYTPSLFEFKGKVLNVQHFTYEENTKIFDGISNKTEKSSAQMNYVLLEPTLSEWKSISQNQLFGNKILFNRM